MWMKHHLPLTRKHTLLLTDDTGKHHRQLAAVNCFLKSYKRDLLKKEGHVNVQCFWEESVPAIKKQDHIFAHRFSSDQWDGPPKWRFLMWLWITFQVLSQSLTFSCFYQRTIIWHPLGNNILRITTKGFNDCCLSNAFTALMIMMWFDRIREKKQWSLLSPSLPCTLCHLITLTTFRWYHLKKKTATQKVWCVLIINLHITMYQVSGPLAPFFSI